MQHESAGDAAAPGPPTHDSLSLSGLGATVASHGGHGTAASTGHGGGGLGGARARGLRPVVASGATRCDVEDEEGEEEDEEEEDDVGEEPDEEETHHDVAAAAAMSGAMDAAAAAAAAHHVLLDPADIDVRYFIVSAVRGAPTMQLALTPRNGGIAALEATLAGLPGLHSLVAPRFWIVYAQRAFELVNPQAIRTNDEVFVTGGGADLTLPLYNECMRALSRPVAPPGTPWAVQPVAVDARKTKARGEGRRKRKTIGTAGRLLEHLLQYDAAALEREVLSVHSDYAALVDRVNALIARHSLPKSRPAFVAKQTWSQGQVLMHAQLEDAKFALRHRKVGEAYPAARHLVPSRRARRASTSRVLLDKPDASASAASAASASATSAPDLVAMAGNAYAGEVARGSEHDSSAQAFLTSL